MTYTAKTVFYFGIYMLLEGLILLLIPNVLLLLVNLPLTSEVWIRLLGLALMILGYYYIKAGKEDLRIFFGWTVPVRIIQFFVVLGVVIFTSSAPVILLFSAIELSSGLWTRHALKAKGK